MVQNGVRLLLHGLGGRRGTGECCFSLVHPLSDDDGSLGEAGTMPSSCVSLRMLLEEFPVLCARVVRTWNLVHYFVVLVPAVTDTGVWVLLLSTENWIFREMSVFLGAMLGSTVDTVYASTLAFGRTAHIFTLRQTRILTAFLLHSV